MTKEEQPGMITTSRLILRPFRHDDLNDLGAILGDPVVMKFSDNGALDRAAQVDWLQRAQTTKDARHLPLVGAIQLRSGGGLIGYISLSNDLKRVGQRDAEIGFRLAHACWGNGFATEAAIAMIAHAKTIVGIYRVVAIVDPNNHQSIRVLEKLGMGYEAEVVFDGYDYPDHRFDLALH